MSNNYSQSIVKVTVSSRGSMDRVLPFGGRGWEFSGQLLQFTTLMSLPGNEPFFARMDKKHDGGTGSILNWRLDIAVIS